MSRESEFDINPSADRNIAQANSMVNMAAINVYQLMDEAYHGTGGFRDGRYLIPFARESNYNARRQLAHYKNYTKPIVRAMVEPVFSEIAPRSVKDEAGNDVENLFRAFIDDCDASETYLQDYTHKAVNVCRRHGVVFTVMDNFDSTAQPATVSEALTSRIYPYIYMKKANEVESYSTDQFGNLTEICFTDATVKVNGVEQRRWRRWDQQDSVLLSKSSDGKNSWVEISRATHGLGVVPVLMSFSESREETQQILPDPPLYDLARLNAVIYNQSAEIRDQERSQAFSIFYMQGAPAGDLAIGPTNFINIPDGATISPGYASPNFAIIQGLVQNQEQIRKDLFTIAEQAGVVGVQSSESGIAKAFDFFAHEETLKTTSRIATTLEEGISELFKKYTKEDFVYVVIYPMDFAPMGLDRDVDRIDKVLKMPNLNFTFAAKIQEKLARLMMADEDQSVVKEIITSIQDVLKETQAAAVMNETLSTPGASTGTETPDPVSGESVPPVTEDETESQSTIETEQE